MKVAWILSAAVLCGSGLFADGGNADEPLAQEEGAFQPFTGQIKGARVRLRTQPTLDGHIVRELGKDDLLVIVGEAHDYFAVLPPEDVKSYVYRTYILDNEVQGTHVNVRLQPDTESPIIGQLNKGDYIKGELLADDNHWLEIAPPEGACFFVAKQFLEKVGGPDMVAAHRERLKEVGHLLNSAYLTSQSELRKSFDEIDFQKVQEGFERVVSEYSDFPEFAEKAEKVLAMTQELYLQKKIAYLESRAAANTWDMGGDLLAADLEEYQRQLKGFEEELQQQGLVDAHQSQVEMIESGLAVAEETFFGDIPDLGLEAPHFVAEPEHLTAKMALWMPVEQSLYHLWAMEHGNATMAEYYREQEYAAKRKTGIIESYARAVQNRPGDFMLRIDGKPAGFLYSTKVNLDELVGKEVELKVVERPNHHFAYPAYFVIATS